MTSAPRMALLALIVTALADMSVTCATPVSSLASASGATVATIRGDVSGPLVPFIKHTVRLSITSAGRPACTSMEIHSGDWIRWGFRRTYPTQAWVQDCILQFGSYLRQPPSSSMQVDDV